MPPIALDRAKAPFVLVIDIGSSSLRGFVYDAQARQVSELHARQSYKAHTTEDGGAELDPAEMFEAYCRVIDNLVSMLAGRVEVAAVATLTLATNLLGLDAHGVPVTPAYLYSDTRCAGAVAALRAAHDWTPIYRRTGAPLHTSYLPARLVWLREEQPAVFGKVARWASLGEYFQLRLFGHAAVSYSFASWSGMLNHQTLDWDDEVLVIAGVTREQLSRVAPPDAGLQGLIGEFAARWKMLDQTPFFPAISDGAAANLGSGCVDRTRAAVTVGTSAAMRVVLPVQEGMERLPPGLWLYRVDETRGLLGGSLNNGGNVFAYLREVLVLPDDAELEKEMSALDPDSHGLTILPFFAGERSPGYRGDATAAIVGWRFATRGIEIWRAAVEAISYRLALIGELLTRAVGAPQEIVASGAALEHSRGWVQILADVLGAPVTLSGEPEASSRGAALVALRALEVIEDVTDLPAAMGETYEPCQAHHEIYRAARERQEKLYDRLLAERAK